MISLIIAIIFDVYTIAYVYINVYGKFNIGMETIFPPFHLSTLSIYPSTPQADLTGFPEHCKITIKNELIRVRK